MNSKRLIALIATCAALGSFGSTAFAETKADMSFDAMVAMKAIDMNKDGMVSKKEFLDSMAKVWDEKAKAMSVKGDKMNDDQYKQFLLYMMHGA